MPPVGDLRRLLTCRATLAGVWRSATRGAVWPPPSGNLLQDLGHHAGADGVAALADREPQTLFHRDRDDQIHRYPTLSPGMTISTPSGSCALPGHVRRPEVELRTVAREERGVAATLLVASGCRPRPRTSCEASPNPACRAPCPRSTSSFFTPRSRRPTLSPARPSSRIFRNISTPVHTVFRVSRMPTISTFVARLDHPALDATRGHRPATGDR